MFSSPPLKIINCPEGMPKEKQSQFYIVYWFGYEMQFSCINKSKLISFEANEEEMVRTDPSDKKFNYNTHYIESHFYTPNNVRLLSLYDYTLPNKEILAKSENFDEEDETAIEDLLEQITLDPATLADAYGYVNTDVKVLFHFLNDSFTFDNTKHKFFIKSISEDRTEIALFSNTTSFSRLRSTVEDLKDKLLNESYFDELWLNFGDNDLFIITNIDTFKVDNLNTVTVKLYEPLPERYDIDSTLQVVEKISDSVAVRVIPEFIEEQGSAPFLQGPNFSVEVNDSRGEPTGFQDFIKILSTGLEGYRWDFFRVVADRESNEQSYLRRRAEHMLELFGGALPVQVQV